MIGVYKKTTEGEKLVYKTDNAARATDYKAALETIDQESNDKDDIEFLNKSIDALKEQKNVLTKRIKTLLDET